MKKSVIIILFCFFSLSAFSDTKLTLVPSKCVLTGEDNGAVKVLDGEKVPMNCKVIGDKMNCGQSGKPQESYEAILDNGLLIARSASGNIFILGDMKKNTYSTASSHLIPEKGMLMTKHCSGVIK